MGDSGLAIVLERTGGNVVVGIPLTHEIRTVPAGEATPFRGRTLPMPRLG